jgi:3-deoxy-D-manno-octulosonic-acid transferase
LPHKFLTMLFLYNLIVVTAGFVLKIIAFFSPKIKLFVAGRKDVFNILKQKIKPLDQTIWFHTASLGEYEQGLPVMEEIKKKFSNHKIVLTFFSPSGYEVCKNNAIADVTIYLPLDTKSNAKIFLELVHPEKVFFIKYEFWLNYLNELKKQNTQTYLISGVFRENQIFFKWYGGFYKKALETFTCFFVQNKNSKELLKTIGFTNAKISGDTRFDRVVSILERDNSLDFIKNFKNNTTTIVIGSSWTKDEDLLVNFINQTTAKVKFIIAPHNIKKEQIQELKNSISKKTVLFTDVLDTLHATTLQKMNLQDFDVFIIDTVGILTKIYSYATIAYVGGGFGNPGVHNILEPATFGLPIVIGSNYSHFAEATALVNNGGCVSVSNQETLDKTFNNLILNAIDRNRMGKISHDFVQNSKGATAIILNEI